MNRANGWRYPYVQACMALDQDPDLKASCPICLLVCLASKLPPDILGNNCINRPPLDKIRLLGGTQVIPDKGDTDSLTVAPSRPRLL